MTQDANGTFSPKAPYWQCVTFLGVHGALLAGSLVWLLSSRGWTPFLATGACMIGYQLILRFRCPGCRKPLMKKRFGPDRQYPRLRTDNNRWPERVCTCCGADLTVAPR